MKLYEKLHTIQKAVKGLGKDKKSHNFSYVTGNKLLSVVRPLMDDLKLLLKQEVLEIHNERMDYKTKYGEKSEILSKVMMRFTWIDVETGDEDVNLFGSNGQNDWEKGLGSALTYAERYFLMKYFHIATDEDDIDNPDRKPEEKAPAKRKTAPSRATPVKAKPADKPATQQQMENIITLKKLKNVSEEIFTKQLVHVGCDNFLEITDAQAKKLIVGYANK